jgi:ABC-2 type transport system ATP-binding protein
MEYYGRLSGLQKSRIRSRRIALLENVGLDERARDSIKKYSKGMLQRLGLAQALLHDPDLLILDEPTDGLDPVGRSHVRNVLRELKKQGKTVFLNSHLLQEVEMICDRVAILDGGLVKAIGTVDELAADQTEGVELELTLAGPAAGIQDALGDRGVKSRVVNGEGHHELQMRLMDQVDVDAIVDDLRQEGLSIVGLRRKRVTLEDTFLSLFAETPDGDR